MATLNDILGYAESLANQGIGADADVQRARLFYSHTQRRLQNVVRGFLFFVSHT